MQGNPANGAPAGLSEAPAVVRQRLQGLVPVMNPADFILPPALGQLDG